MFKKTLIPWLVLASAGCASAGAPEATLDGDAQEDVVELTVINRTSGAVTAYVEWESGRRVPLGELMGRQTRTFVTPHRDFRFRLSLNVLSAPPPITAGGPSPRRSTQPFVFVNPGDRYEWEIRQTVPSIDLFYRRLSP